MHRMEMRVISGVRMLCHQHVLVLGRGEPGQQQTGRLRPLGVVLRMMCSCMCVS